MDYDVGRTEADGYDRGILKDASSDAIKGHGSTTGEFSVDRLTIGTSDFRAPLVRIVNGEPLSRDMLDGIKLGRFEYQGFHVRPPGKPPVALEELSVGPLAFAHGLPTSGAMGFRGLVVSAAQLPDARGRDAFAKLGLDAATISFNLAFEWDAATGKASVRDTVLKVNELGTVALSADLTNLGADPATAALARLVHAKLRFDDASLVDRVLAMAAAQAGADRDCIGSKSLPRCASRGRRRGAR